MRKLIVLLTAALLLSGCATVPKYGAGKDIHDFLLAVRDNNRFVFDNHVDRPALKAQLRGRAIAEAPGLIGQGQGRGLAAVAGAVLAGPLIDAAVDNLVQPEVFLLIAQRLGYSPSQPIPGALIIARSLRAVGPGRVCVQDGDRCGLVFADEGDAWRLVAYEGDLGRLSSKLLSR